MKIYNEKTRKKEEFVTLEERKVKMYVCGPTLYGEIHIGNARPLIFFDVVYRILSSLDYSVDYVSNITDIDDKIIQKAADAKLTEKELVDANIVVFKETLDELNIKSIMNQPYVSDYMEEIVDFIVKLIRDGYAYSTEDGDVYFRVNKIPTYGEISNRNIEELSAGARVDINDAKENELDFALWKSTDKGIQWDTPFGKGRPGWHTECVVMINEILGNRIDIHGGGMDLKFPHHENENAQNIACSSKELANYWMHNGFVNINDEKMSKSLENFITVSEILDKYDANVLRLLLLQTNYRQPINLTDEFVQETVKIAERIQEYIAEDEDFESSMTLEKTKEELAKLTDKRILDSMEDDFNIPNLISLLLEYIKTAEAQQEVKIICYLLGLQKFSREEIPEEIHKLADERNLAKTENNYEKADRIREEIRKKGYELLDTRDGVEIKKIK